MRKKAAPVVLHRRKKKEKDEKDEKDEERQQQQQKQGDGNDGNGKNQKEKTADELKRQCEKAEDFPKPPVPIELEHWWEDIMANYFPTALIVTIVLMGANMGIYCFWRFVAENAWIPWQIQLAIFVFFQVQAIANVAAIKTQAYKDCPTYQLNRLGISAKQMALKSTRAATMYDGQKVYREWKHCKLCDRIVPLRSVHCEICGRCMLRNDHHCYVVGCCLGVQTLRYFLAMTFYLLLIGGLGFSVCVRYHWDDLIWLAPRNKADLWSGWNGLIEVFGRLWHDPTITMEAFVWRVLNSEKPIYLTSMCMMTATVALVGGLLFTKQGVLGIYRGFTLQEAYHLWYVIKGDEYRTTLVERIGFVMGKSFPRGLLWPRMWEEVDWDEKHKASLLLDPLIADEDLLAAEEEKKGINEQSKQ